MRYPGFVPALLTAALTLSGCATQSTPADTTASTTTTAPAPDRPSVATLQIQLSGDPAVHISQRDGWTNAEDSRNFTLWSFTPATHPAHPSVVQRRVIRHQGVAQIETIVLCEAAEQACTELRDEFDQRNRRIQQRMNQPRSVIS